MRRLHCFPAWPSEFGPLLPFACVRSLWPQRGAAGGARQGLMLWRSALRADSTAMLAPRSRRRTHCVRCAHSVRTTAPSQSTKRASRADPGPGFSSPQKSPPPGTARRADPLVLFPQEAPACPQRRVRADRGAPLGRREAQGSWPRAKRESSTDSSQLSERSERSERSEFCDGAARPSIAGQSARSADRPSQALRAARTRLCRTDVRAQSGRSRSATGRKLTFARQSSVPRGSREARWSN